jgi:hypothetical protein
VATLIMSKAPHHGRVTSNLSLKSLLHRQSRVQQPSRAQIADFATNGTRILDESGRLGEYQGMALRLVQFLAIMFTALALVPSGAHLAALPNNIHVVPMRRWYTLTKTYARDRTMRV